MRRVICIGMLSLALGACGNAANEDLQQWMNDASKGLVAKVDPLPEVRQYQPFSYAGFDLEDPFKPRKINEEQKQGSNTGPDLSRRKELLESYPLDQLKFVGTLEQSKTKFALVLAEQTVHRVKVGNYLGQNFGRVMDIGDQEVKLRENVQEGEGEWKENDVTLYLSEESHQEQKK